MLTSVWRGGVSYKPLEKVRMWSAAFSKEQKRGGVGVKTCEIIEKGQPDQDLMRGGQVFMFDTGWT